MAMDEVLKEIKLGKKGWNVLKIGLKDQNIVLKDETGYIDFPEEAIDDLIDGIDESRRRLREIQRIPTSRGKDEDEDEEDES